MVGALVLALFMALFNVALALYVRNILQDSAAEGARLGAVAGSSPAVGVERTRYLISLALPEREVAVRATAEDYRGVPTLRIDVSTPLPVFAFGGGLTLDVTAHALREDGLP